MVDVKEVFAGKEYKILLLAVLIISLFFVVKMGGELSVVGKATDYELIFDASLFGDCDCYTSSMYYEINSDTGQCYGNANIDGPHVWFAYEIHDCGGTCADIDNDAYLDGGHVCFQDPESTCNDGLDNDGDGLVDCDDPSCSGLDGCPVIETGDAETDAETDTETDSGGTYEITECDETVTSDATLTEGGLDCEGGTAITIASGVTLDCQGETLSGNGSGYGVIVEADGVLIKDCIIEDFEYGIYSIYDNLEIVNNSISDSKYGIKQKNGESSEIHSNEFLEISSYAIYFYSMDSSEIYENNIGAEADKGIYLSESNQINIYENIIKDETYGIVIQGSDGNVLDSNNISNIESQSIVLTGSDSNTVSNNFGTEVSVGIYLTGSHENTVTSNSFFGLNDGTENVNGLEIIDDYGSSNTNTFTSNYFDGFYQAFFNDNAGENNVFDTNYFCNSYGTDLYCENSSELYSGIDNFIDTINYCVGEANTDLCGTIITDDSITYYLEENWDCSSNTGIIIEGDGITIDCNGYTLSGDDSIGTYGIEISEADDVTIQNCIVDGFYYGIYSHGSSSNLLELNVSDVQIQNADEVGIRTQYTSVNLINSYFTGNFVDSYFTDDTELDHYVEGVVMCDSIFGGNMLCSTTLGVAIYDSDIYSIDSDCNAGEGPLGDCSSPSLSLKETNGYFAFPSDLTDTRTCQESQACSDDHDNDNDGLIDCADSDCAYLACGGQEGWACIEGECIEVEVPEAQQATLEVETAYIGFLWTYSEIFDWLNAAEVYFVDDVDETFTSCDDLCEYYDKTCLFSDAGRTLCSSELLEKCTCI